LPVCNAEHGSQDGQIASFINPPTTRRKNMSIFKRVIITAVMALFVIGAVGCGKEEGTMEKAGKKVDEAIEKTEEAVKEKTE
jgi:hypothetical protein